MAVKITLQREWVHENGSKFAAGTVLTVGRAHAQLLKEQGYLDAPKPKAPKPKKKEKIDHGDS